MMASRAAWVAAALALAALAALAPAAAAGREDPVEAAERIERRYGRMPATETEVLLEEAPTCVPNVANILGVLPSSCCGDMRCPINGGICCKGNTHCCPNGFMCVQGDPGTPPGCLDMVGKDIPVAVHKIMQRHHLKVHLVKPPAKPKVQVPGARPSGRLNYEDAMAPAAQNPLSKMRNEDVTVHHRVAGGDAAAKTPRDAFVLPNLPGFPIVPANRISSGDSGPAPPPSEAQKPVGRWVPPGDVDPVGGGVKDGGGNPVGLRAVGTDPVVMLPETPEGQERAEKMVANADDSISAATARLGAEVEGHDVVSVRTLKVPVRLGTLSEVLSSDEAFSTEPRFREVEGTPRRAPAEAAVEERRQEDLWADGQGLGADMDAGSEDQEDLEQQQKLEEEEDEEAAGGRSPAAGGGKAFSLEELRRTFPPAPEVAEKDPPPPPSRQEQVLARLQAQLDKVNSMQADLRRVLADAERQDAAAGMVITA